MLIPSSRRVVVLGASGHAKVVIAALRELGIEVLVALDDNPLLQGTSVMGVPVKGTLNRVAEFGEVEVVIAIGNNRMRMVLAQRMASGRWARVVHPTAWVAPSAKVGGGSVVFAGAVVQPDACLGEHVIVNTGASVDHDSQVGSFVHLAPGARLAGGVSIGEGAFLGIGSVVIPGLRVGAWATVGAGAVVIRDVPAEAVVAGVPARVLHSAQVR